jgi:hypothetical protein
MRSHARFGPLMISLVVGGLLSGCFSSTKEVEMVPAPVVQAPPPVVQVPPPVVVAPNPNASQTTTSTSWGQWSRGTEEDHEICQRPGTKSDDDYLGQWNAIL